MAGDISKKVVLVMLVLAIVVAVTGTWLVLENIEEAGSRATVVGLEKGTGNVKLHIGPEEGQPGIVKSGDTAVKLTIK